MPSQNTVVVNVSTTATLPQVQGFSLSLIAAFHDILGPVIRTVSSIQDAESQGFTAVAAPALNRMLTVVFSQRPSLTSVLVGRRTTGTLTQVLTCAPLAAQGTGFVWTITIDGLAITYTEQAADTPTLIVAGLLSAVNLAVVDVTASSPVVTTLTLTGDAPPAQRVHSFSADRALYTIGETTLDPGLVTDLTAFEGIRNDWYGLALDSNSPAEIAAAAGWTETRSKLLGADTYTSDVIDPGDSSDVASLLKIAIRNNTYTAWANGSASAYYALSWMAAQFQYKPGRATWNKRASGGIATYGILNTTDQTTLEAKFVGHYEQRTQTQPATARWYQGKVASGQYTDVIRYVAYVASRLVAIVYNYLDNNTALNGKVPITDAAIGGIGELLQIWVDGEVADNALADDGSFGPPVLTLPTAASIPAADRAERLLQNITLQAQLAGAIHDVIIDVRLTQ